MSLLLTPGQFSRRGEFYYQLGQLSAAGIGMIRAVDMLVANPPARSYLGPLRQLQSYLAAGETFSDALARLGLWTPAFDVALINAGEKSGRLDAVFNLLSTYYAERAVLLRRVLSDLAYPVFLFHFSVAMFPFVAWIQNGNWNAFLVHTLGIFVPLYLLVFGLVYAAQGRRGELWRATLERLLHPVPVIGTCRRSLAMARLAMALEALLNAGVTIIEAWELAAAASGSPALHHAVARWRMRLLEGETPAEVVNSSREFPRVFANLYQTGEVSGQLDETLRRLHLYYQEEGTRKLKLITTVGPRVVYFAVAILVGLKVIGFYSGYLRDLDSILKAA